MRKAVFTFLFDSIEEANITAKSIEPEIKKQIPKTRVKMSLKERTITLEILSEDTSSLRAACNSFLRWIKTAFDVQRML